MDNAIKEKKILAMSGEQIRDDDCVNSTGVGRKHVFLRFIGDKCIKEPTSNIARFFKLDIVFKVCTFNTSDLEYVFLRCRRP